MIFRCALLHFLKTLVSPSWDKDELVWFWGQTVNVVTGHSSRLLTDELN